MGRRAKGEGSIYPLANGKWRAEISWTDPEGVRRHTTRTRKTKIAAGLELRKLLNARPASVCQKYMHEFLTDWLKSGEWEPSTVYGYTNAIVKHICPVLGSLRLCDLGPEHIEQWLAKIRCGTRTKQMSYDVLRRALEFARKREYITKNPTDHVSRPKNKREEIDPFTVEEVQAILAASAGHSCHPILLLGFSVGMRQGEMFGLRWSDVDLRTATITISRQSVEVGGRTHFAVPKTKSSIRRVSVPKAAMASLERLYGGRKDDQLVFPNRSGAVRRRGTFRTRFWKPLLARLKIRHRGAHHMRHTYATHVLGAGVPVHIVSQVLGHNRTATTFDLYCKAIPAQQQQASVAIDILLTDSVIPKTS